MYEVYNVTILYGEIITTVKLVNTSITSVIFIFGGKNI
jgi:hypothetical protein